MIIRNSNCGNIVPCGDADGLEHALKELSEDPELRKKLGQNGRLYHEKYLCQTIAGQKFVRAVTDW